MFMSRVKLDTMRQATRRAVSSPQILHAALERCFFEHGRTLWRLDYYGGCLYMIAISKERPDFTSFTPQFCADGESVEIKDYISFLSSLKEGQRLRFRFKGNPVHSVPEEKGLRGKVYAHVTSHHKNEWMLKKSISNGFLLTEGRFDMVETGQMRFFRESKPVILTYAIFEGELVISEIEVFLKALTQGIGRAKAYGCGLMTVGKI